MKTSEEIKKGLEQCADLSGACEGVCPYFMVAGCLKQCKDDAISYIEHLESKLAQAERERDAMLLALKEVGCGMCKYAPHEDDIYIHNQCHDCVKQCNFEWRGVCPENTKEEN